jgi:ADP-ribosylglycohydrolase
MPLFTKGDPRINRKGRPKSFDKLRALAQSISHEPAKDKNGDPIIIDGHVATIAEMVLRDMLRDKKHQREFLEIAFGKVPNPQQAIDLTTNGESLNDGLSTEERVAAALAIFAATPEEQDSQTPE